MNNDVEIIKSRINIVEIVSEKVRLKKAGVNYFGLCPFHSEKTPSFSVNENIQMFKCFGCGEHGDVFTFLMKTENLEFREALEELAEKAGYKLNHKSKVQSQRFEQEEKLYKVNSFVSNWFQKRLAEGENEGMLYARKRGITHELMKKFGIGYIGGEKAELTNYLTKKNLGFKELEQYGLSVNKNGTFIDKFRNRLMFNISDEKGRVVGFTGRYVGVNDPNFTPPKYLNSPETLVFRKSHILFGLYQAKVSINKLNFVIVTEGQMNVISSHKAGVQNIVASSGTSFTEDHLKILQKYTNNIYFAFDKDNAGKKALLRSLEMTFRQDINAKVISWDPKLGKDPDELISHGGNYWVEATNNPVDPIEFIFTEFSHKYSIEDLDKVNAFLKTVLKLISIHKNEVKKEFYIKYLSEQLEISVMALKDLLRTGFKETYRTAPKIEEKKINDDRVISKYRLNIFDKIFALILQYWNEVKQILPSMEREFLPEEYQEIYDCLSLLTEESSISTLREYVDSETKEMIDNFLLTNIIFDSNISVKEHLLKLIKQSKNEYKKLLILEWKRHPDDAELVEKVNRIVGGRKVQTSN